ncbi:lariat debranching enzyme, partial [Mortierella sp. AD010]
MGTVKYHGGWVCPDIYFLGWGGVINVGGMRIGGMSGIYKRNHYETGHYEVTPFNDNHKRSIYHVRKYDIHKMLQVKEPMDVFLSHDWPLGVERYGNIEWLLRTKPFFTREVNTNTLGSAPYGEVLSSLRPAHWFSAHLHVRYTATVHWNTQGQSTDRLPPQQQSVSQPQARASESATAEVIKNPDEIEIDLDDEENANNGTKVISSEPAKNPDEINIDLDDEGEAEAKAEVITTPAVTYNPEEIQIEMDDEENEDPEPADTQPVPAPQQTQTQVHQESANTSPKPYPTCTKFLALDKCHGGRKYLEVINLPEFTGPIEFKYDEEWLAIVRTLDPYLSLEYNQRKPLEGDELSHALKVNREWVRDNITKTRGLAIPLNFQQTTPAHDPVRTMGPQEKRDF